MITLLKSEALCLGDGDGGVLIVEKTVFYQSIFLVYPPKTLQYEGKMQLPQSPLGMVLEKNNFPDLKLVQTTLKGKLSKRNHESSDQ